jgi:hypothetical protein
MKTNSTWILLLFSLLFGCVSRTEDLHFSTVHNHIWLRTLHYDPTTGASIDTILPDPQIPFILSFREENGVKGELTYQFAILNGAQVVFESNEEGLHYHEWIWQDSPVHFLVSGEHFYVNNFSILEFSNTPVLGRSRLPNGELAYIGITPGSGVHWQGSDMVNNTTVSFFKKLE